MNSINLFGNVVADPKELKTQSGKKCAAFRLAVDDFRNGKKITYYFDVLTFQKTAEATLAHLKKGKRCNVNGKLTTREYKAKDGTNRVAVEILANLVDILDWEDEETVDTDEVAE